MDPDTRGQRRSRRSIHRKDHWERIYTTRGEGDVSWFEELPATSLRMLEAAGLARTTCVIDVGGGDSRLVDALHARGLACLAVLDVSGAALDRARARLGAHGAAAFHWIEADVTADWSAPPMDIWHDRAVFHFLTAPADRATYRDRLARTLKPGGAAVLATFGPDGPEQCSGLPVRRYSADALAAELGAAFRLEEAAAHRHTTPWGSVQPFVYARFTRTQ